MECGRCDEVFDQDLLCETVSGLFPEQDPVEYGTGLKGNYYVGRNRLRFLEN